ncbi:MAG: metalloregulator ArsR/SmtB family transcription factor [Spirochaetaceae bacterium]|nr:metalloregulator ArsR/SmtB family transcription factor [Spirochaetaceae bacterium]
MKNVEASNERMLELYAKKLKVCGHPLRLKILTVIKDETACVKELWEYLEQPQPVVSQHLAVLKESGIVNSEVDGNRRVYAIIDPFVDEIIPLIKISSGNKK